MRSFWAYALLAALVAVILRLSDELVQKAGDWEIPLVILILIGLSVIISTADNILNVLYAKIPFIRRLYYNLISKDGGFIEGHWVDVSFFYQNGIKTYHSFAHIIISYKIDSLYVHGLTWNTAGHLESDWASFLTSYKRGKLYFDYEADYRFKISHNKSKGVSEFSFSEAGTHEPQNYTGTYESDGKIYIVEPKKIEEPKELLARDNKQRKAKAYLYFREMIDMDRIGRIQVDTSGGINFSQPSTWFATFMNATNQKELEKSMITDQREKIAKILEPQNTQILGNSQNPTIFEIGTGNGEMTCFLLKQLWKSELGFNYTGFEMDASEAEIAKNRIKESFSRAKLNIISRDANNIEQHDIPQNCSIILCLHSLYYINELESILAYMCERNNMGRCVLVFMHTEESDFLKSVQILCGTRISTNIPSKLREFFENQELKVAESIGEEIVVFPRLSDDEWDKVRKNQLQPDIADHVNEMILLLSFMVQKSANDIQQAGNWEVYVKIVRKFLIENGDRLSLNVSLQWVVV